MSERSEINLITPTASLQRSYLTVAREFKKEKLINNNFLITKLSGPDILALSIGFLDFNKKIVKPCRNIWNEIERINFNYWIVQGGEYIGELCIRDRPLASSTLKDKAAPQQKWKELYRDNTDRYTTISLILKPASRTMENMDVIFSLLSKKLEELGFTEFAVRHSKKDGIIKDHTHKISKICDGKIYETSKTIEFVIPINSEKARKALSEEILHNFIQKDQPFKNFIEGLKEHIISDVSTSTIPPTKTNSNFSHEEITH